MKAGTFNHQEYLDRLPEDAEGNTEKGYILSDTAGLPLPEDTKKNFDWLNKEYQKGKVEVQVVVKGEGSSFKPGYDLQTDLKSVKDFKPGMYGDIKTTQSETPEPKSPKNKKEGTPAEGKVPPGDNETKDKDKKADTSAEAQSLEIDATKKKKDDKK